MAAAQAVLNPARVTAAEAALGHWARLEWRRGASTVARPFEENMEAAAAFTLAETAAILRAPAASPSAMVFGRD